MGNNMCSSTIAVGEKTHIPYQNITNFFENDKIEEGTLLNATKDNLDPFLYHLGKFGEDAFKTLEHSQIHSFYLGCEKDGEN